LFAIYLYLSGFIPAIGPVIWMGSG